MVGFVFKRILLPLILWFLIVALSSTLIAEEYASLQPLPALVFLIVLVYWWLTGIARFLVRRWRWVTVGYLFTNLAVAFVLTSGFWVAGEVLDFYGSRFTILARGAALISGPGWLLESIIHLLRNGQRRRKGILWRLLADWLEQGLEQAPPKKQPPPKPQPASRQRASTTPRSSTTTPKRASQSLFTQVGAGGDGAAVPGVAIPPRTSTPRRVSNDAQEFVAQAQEWALRQEYVGNYVPFEAYSPTYSQMSFEQQQWYFYWRTQLRQGKFLATDLSYLFVYLYELLNVVGVNAPGEARDRLVTFWQAYRSLQPMLDNYVVDWVADFSVLHTLPESTLAWYAHALSAGVTNRNAESLQLEAWHQQGRDYNALPAATLYALANYAVQQNKFYQAYQSELALDDALKRGVAVVDGYVQESQRLSLYELHLPMPTQTVMRPPLLGAVHCYPTTPIVIGRVRPWTSETTLKDDLKAILRYTENILRTQAAYKTKLRGVTLPPAWATALDQAFVKAPPKRVVNIDLAGAAALQLESDELRQRLLDTEETLTDPLTPAESAPARRSQQPPPVVESISPNSAPPIQRPHDAPAGLLTDLPALAAILENASSEATALLSALRDNEWQSQAANLQVGENHQFVSVIFDRINERALAELGDGLLFIEGDEWVVAEDYRDEIAYLLDHPDFAPHQDVSVEAGATSSTVATKAAAIVEGHDLIPTGWEECVRQMQPLGWATLAIVMEQEDCMSKLEALARSHYVTANQLLDQVNETGLETMGDNLIDVAGSSPQVIEEYQDALEALLLWAEEHDQIEGLPGIQP